MFNVDNNNFKGYQYDPKARDINNLNVSRRATIQQRLWTVHDAYVDKPTERFRSTRADVLLENACEMGFGPMTNNSLPEDMVLFVKQMIEAFGVSPNRYEAEDCLYELLYILDFQEPYWLLVDSAVNLVNEGNVVKTYRFRDSGRVIEPDKCEVFKIEYGWRFAPYEAAMSMIRSQGGAAVLAGQTITGKDGRHITKMTLLHKVIECVYGSPNYMDVLVGDVINNRYDCEVYYRSDTPYEAEDAQINWDLDYEFFTYTFAAGMLWLRSPQAMQYLIKTHPVYAALLDWNDKTMEPVAIPGTGNIAVATGYDVYTAKHLYITDSPAGTCFCCGQTLHCTKFVNINGLRGDPCNCGRGAEDPTDTHMYNHASFCNAPKTARFEFLCYKCMKQTAMAGAHMPKCDRITCPNTTCNWHMGADARIRGLTENRKRMLTAPTQ